MKGLDCVLDVYQTFLLRAKNRLNLITTVFIIIEIRQCNKDSNFFPDLKGKTESMLQNVFLIKLSRSNSHQHLIFSILVL